MIKFTFEGNDNRSHLGLGVSRENVDRMIAGQPIRFDLAQLGVKVDGSIMIFFGETERDLQQTIAEFIGPDTKVQIDPRLKSKLT